MTFGWWSAEVARASRQAAETGRVPSYRVGKYRRFRLSEIENWLVTQRQAGR